MSNRVSAVMVVFYQLGSRRASSSMLTPEVGGELELLRRQSFQAGRASQLSGPWTQLLPRSIGGPGGCLRWGMGCSAEWQATGTCRVANAPPPVASIRQDDVADPA